jgi:hypothetical protein
MADRAQRLAGGGQGYRVRGMSVNHPAHVRAGVHDLGVDRVPAVPGSAAGQHLAVRAY